MEEKKLSTSFSNEDENSSDAPHGSSSVMSSAFKIVCTIAGTGILSLPITIKDGGWASVLLLFLGAAAAFYSGLLIVECLYHKEDQRLEGYPDVGYAAFGNIGKYIVLFNHYCIIFGGVTTYILLVGFNFTQIITGCVRSEVCGDKSFDYKERMMIAAAGCTVFLIYTAVKSLKESTLVSFLGVASTVIVVVFLPVLAATPSYGVKEPATHTAKFVSSGIFSSLAFIAFSYGGSVVFPHVEQTMKEPKNWKKALLFSITGVTILYAVFSITCYWLIGDEIEAPVFKNLRQTLPIYTVSLSMTVHLVMASPVYLCSFATVFENRFGITVEQMGKAREFWLRFISRLVLVTILTSIAVVAKNHFKGLVGIVGAVNNSIIIFIVPVVCHLKLFGFKNRTYFQYICLFLVFTLGLICLSFGTIDSVNSFVKDLNKTD